MLRIPADDGAGRSARSPAVRRASRIERGGRSGWLASAALAILATAIANLAMSDWQADVQSGQAWAGLRLTPAHLSLAVEVAAASDSDPRYWTSASDEALSRAFRTQRDAAARAARGVPEFAIPERVLRTVVRLPSQAVRTLKRRARKETAQLRLVANGDAWPGWPALAYPRADRTRRVIVLSKDNARPLAEASGGSGGTETEGAAGCRGPPQIAPPRTGVSAHLRVHDNLGHRIPIGQAELDVIESFLEREQQELLAGAIPAGDRKGT